MPVSMIKKIGQKTDTSLAIALIAHCKINLNYILKNKF